MEETLQTLTEIAANTNADLPTAILISGFMIMVGLIINGWGDNIGGPV